MGRRKPNVIFLDTHVILWLYDALLDRLSDNAKNAIEHSDIMTSWLVKLELQYLHEIGRVRVKPAAIIDNLEQTIGLTLSSSSPANLIDAATKHSWTRDVFDRLLVADAEVHRAGLVTKDETIRQHFRSAIW